MRRRRRYCGTITLDLHFRWVLVVTLVAVLAGRAEADPGPDCGVDIEEKCLTFFSSAKSWSPRFDIQEAVHSFATSPSGSGTSFPPAERTREGIFVIPGLEVRIAKKPGCTFAGEVMISESENCKTDPKSPMQVDEVENARTNNMQFFLSLSEARQLLFTDKLDTKFKDMRAAKAEFRLFFCVRPGPGEEFRALHAIWYFQDPEPDRPKAVWEAEDVEIRKDLKVNDPEAWRSEERYRMEPMHLDGIPMDMPQYSYVLMHFQAKDAVEDGENDIKPKAGSGAAASTLAFPAVIFILGSLFRTLLSERP